MKWTAASLLICLPGLTACTERAATRPVVVDTPGMPSPELALQRSVDRVHAFMASLNERLPTPARDTVPLAVTAPSQPVALKPHALLAATMPEATPLRGGNGIVWFAFGEGYAQLRCARGTICILRLQPGETVQGEPGEEARQAGWQLNVVRGAKGIHAAWALALAPTTAAHGAILRMSTNRRRYAVELVPDGESMRTVAFTYAPGDPDTEPAPPVPHAAMPAAVPDFRFTVTGPDVPWKPLRVYRDGGRTYVQFPPGGVLAAPRVAVLAPHTAAPQVRHTVADSYVIDGAVEEMLLSVGTGGDRVTIHIKHQPEAPHA